MRWVLGRGRFGQVEAEMETSWQEFTDFLRDASTVPRDPSLKHLHWWCAPFILRPDMVGVHRRDEDIVGVSNWIALDVDHGNAPLDTLRLKLMGTPHIVYTTASAQPDDMRWRILVLLDRPYSVAEYPRVWRWYANRLALDEQTKNVSRISYLPAQWDGGLNIFHAEYGRPAGVDSVLAMSPEIVTTPSSVPAGALKQAPDGTEIVSGHMLDRAMTAPVGGRLFRVLAQAAKRFVINGWELTEDQLVAAGGHASAVFSPGKKRPNLAREARRALDWASTNFTPLSPLEKMRTRILWERSRHR